MKARYIPKYVNYIRFLLIEMRTTITVKLINFGTAQFVTRGCCKLTMLPNIELKNRAYEVTIYMLSSLLNTLW